MTFVEKAENTGGISCGTFCGVYFYKTLMGRIGLKTAFVLLVSLLGTSSFGESLLKSSSEEFNFGLSISGTTLVHRVWLKSVGTDTAKITNVSTGCSCTTMPLSRKEIAPGDSLEVDIIWDIKGTMGIIRRYPRVFYEGAKDPVLVTMQGYAQHVPDSNAFLSIWPFKFELGKLGEKSVDSIAFRIKNTSIQTIHATLASHELRECELMLPESIAPSSDAYGYIKVRAEYLDKEFENSITIKFSLDDKTFITVPVRRKIYAANP